MSGRADFASVFQNVSICTHFSRCHRFLCYFPVETTGCCSAAPTRPMATINGLVIYWLTKFEICVEGSCIRSTVDLDSAFGFCDRQKGLRRKISQTPVDLTVHTWEKSSGAKLT